MLKTFAPTILLPWAWIETIYVVEIDNIFVKLNEKEVRILKHSFHEASIEESQSKIVN